MGRSRQLQFRGQMSSLRKNKDKKLNEKQEDHTLTDKFNELKARILMAQQDLVMFPNNDIIKHKIKTMQEEMQVLQAELQKAKDSNLESQQAVGEGKEI